jgi:hypothetical protein
MNVKNLLSYAFLVFLPTTLFSQQNFNATKFEKQEIALLDLISKDTISPLNIQLDGEIFKFGQTKPALSSIALIKNKKDIYVQALGLSLIHI